MSKYQITMYNRFARVRQAIDSFYSTQINFEVTFKVYLKNKDDYRKRTQHDRNRLNSYYSGHIAGQDEVMFHDIQRNKVTWRHYLYTKDGDIIYYDCYTKLPEQHKKPYGVFESNHFWINSMQPWGNMSPQNCFNTLGFKKIK